MGSTNERMHDVFVEMIKFKAYNLCNACAPQSLNVLSHAHTLSANQCSTVAVTLKIIKTHTKGQSEISNAFRYCLDLFVSFSLYFTTTAFAWTQTPTERKTSLPQVSERLHLIMDIGYILKSNANYHVLRVFWARSSHEKICPQKKHRNRHGSCFNLWRLNRYSFIVFSSKVLLSCGFSGDRFFFGIENCWKFD